MRRDSTVLSRNFIAELKGVPCDGVDIEDQFQCHAFIWLQFECSTCGHAEFFEDADYPHLGWIVSAAIRARKEGWHSAPWSSEGILEGCLLCSTPKR